MADDLRSLLASQDIRDAVRQRRYGVVLRRARQARGLTQAQAGKLAGYSGATISRFETGDRRLADVDTLRRLAGALGTAPELFGLTPETREFPGGARAATVPGEALLATVVTGLPQDGDDVRRRDMITSTAALAGAAALGRAPAAAGAPRRPAAGLEDVLYGQPDAAPADPGKLRAAITVARGDFRDARYDRVPAALPKIIAAAQATRDHAGARQRAEASGLLADAYLLAADFAVKVNDDPLSWTTSDRALQAAQASGDPLAVADARRAVATAMRRAHHPARAVDLLIRACHDIEPDGHPGPDQLATYGNLLTVAAYTAATAGNRHAAGEYMAEAASAATRLGSATSSRQPAFGQAALTLYQAASPRYSATAAPPSTTRAVSAPPTSPPPSGRAATGSTSPAPGTNGEDSKPATVPCSPPSAPRPPRSVTARPSTGCPKTFSAPMPAAPCRDCATSPAASACQATSGTAHAPRRREHSFESCSTPRAASTALQDWRPGLDLIPSPRLVGRRRPAWPACPGFPVPRRYPRAACPA